MDSNQVIINAWKEMGYVAVIEKDGYVYVYKNTNYHDLLKFVLRDEKGWAFRSVINTLRIWKKINKRHAYDIKTIYGCGKEFARRSVCGYETRHVTEITRSEIAKSKGFIGR